jgi:hypothetical protein
VHGCGVVYFVSRVVLPFPSFARPLVDMLLKRTLRVDRINLSFALLLSLAIAARCQTTSSNKSVADLQWFSGHWSCDGKFAGSGKAISADLLFEPVLDSKWMLFRHDDRPPFSYHALSEWGWDEKGQQYISTVQDSTGGVRVFYSPGFSDSKLVWDGKALGNPAAPAERFEFAKNGPNTFTVSYSFEQDGKWRAVDASTCTRKL